MVGIVEARKRMTFELHSLGWSHRAIAAELALKLSDVCDWIANEYKEFTDWHCPPAEEKVKENRYAEHYQKNKQSYYSRVAARRARKQNAMPDWLTKEHLQQIKNIYAEAQRLQLETGEKYHVDHIYPLVGKTKVDGKWIQVACGLHVPWNLQAIPAKQNLSKSCRIVLPEF